MWLALTDLLFPPACVACGRVVDGPEYFCADCDERVERLPDAACVHCAEPGDFSESGGRCPRCARRPPPFQRAFAPFVHEGAVARAIHQFKYEDHPELAPRLASLLAAEARGFLSTAPPVLCAIPLHRSRFLRRRYDQAHLLTRALAAKLGRAALDGLERIRPTHRQVGLSEAERIANVAGAFRASPEVAGLDLLLVDDVFTTGATARAAAAAALAGGARSVEILTLARAYTL
jgi:ComF family protein